MLQREGGSKIKHFRKQLSAEADLKEVEGDRVGKVLEPPLKRRY